MTGAVSTPDELSRRAGNLQLYLSLRKNYGFKHNNLDNGFLYEDP